MGNNVKVEIKDSTLLNITKADISLIAEEARVKLSEGLVDPLQVLVKAKKGIEMMSALEKIARPFAESKSRLSKGEVYSKYGAEISESMNGVKYDFTVCGDSEWDSINSEMLILDKKKKEREKFLKTLTKPIADSDTGEIINPPIKTGKLGLNIKIK